MESQERERRRRRLLRYLLFQIPGASIVGALLFAAVVEWSWSPRWAAALFGAWLLKDALLYRFVAPAYESDEDSQTDPLIGARGVATETLDPSGYVRIGAELWRAVAAADSAPIARGAEVRVCGRRDLTLRVETLTTPP